MSVHKWAFVTYMPGMDQIIGKVILFAKLMDLLSFQVKSSDYYKWQIMSRKHLLPFNGSPDN